MRKDAFRERRLKSGQFFESQCRRRRGIDYRGRSSLMSGRISRAAEVIALNDVEIESSM